MTGGGQVSRGGHPAGGADCGSAAGGAAGRAGFGGSTGLSGAATGGDAGGVAPAGNGSPTQPSPSQYRWVVGSAGSWYQPGSMLTRTVLQVPPTFLLPLDGLEQRLEV